MRMPLDTIYITGAFKEVAQPGTGLPDGSGVRRHIGVDLRASVGTRVYAVGSGVVTQSYLGGAGNTIEVRIGDKLWRFMHLSERRVQVGARVTEGQVIALSGNTGGVAAHLHVDARRDGTLYNSALSNYFDPLALIKQTQGADMPTTLETAKALAAMAAGRNPADAGNIADLTKNHVGKDPNTKILEWYGSAERKAYLASRDKILADLQTALTNAQNKPPVEVVKEVQVIVEKLVEVEKPVDEKQVVESWLRKLWNSFFNK